MNGAKVPQDYPVENIIVQALVRKLLAGGTTVFEMSTKPFHRVGPVTVHRAPALDAVCDVKKCVDWESTDRKSFGISLVVNSFLDQSAKYLGGERNSLAVLSNPVGKADPDLPNVCSRNLALQTETKKVDEVNEVSIALWVLERVL